MDLEFCKKIKIFLFLVFFIAITINSNSQNKVTTFADTSRGVLMLVNKSYNLPIDYVPVELIAITETYGDSNKMMHKEAYDAFRKMHDDAKTDGVNIWITSAYRDFKYQNWLYNKSIEENGVVITDKTVAQPGFSEHQTGLAIDIVSARGKKLSKEFEKTKQFEWLSTHGHDYGYILRYPNGKESITGYEYEPWHFRYVGIETAQKIEKLNITLDEYYEQFVNIEVAPDTN
ncbi:MAG: M15 family metallopeptidase [Bacteroidales bacterium]|jgi:D-alanyl-D-alanine carboxypeptidase|nr:M15 family metallopeptidase [Bacteroidales bacterium]